MNLFHVFAQQPPSGSWFATTLILDDRDGQIFLGREVSSDNLPSPLPESNLPGLLVQVRTPDHLNFGVVTNRAMEINSGETYFINWFSDEGEATSDNARWLFGDGLGSHPQNPTTLCAVRGITGYQVSFEAGQIRAFDAEDFYCHHNFLSYILRRR